MKRVIKWSATSLVLIMLLGSVGGYWFVHKNIAPVQGTFQLEDMDEEVNIYLDEWEIPHIYATTMENAYFAQGYIQAKDRLFQMDLSRRAIRGRLSEIFGKDFVDIDKFFLTIGFFRAAEKSEEIISEEGIKYLKSFADGVNTYIEENKGNLPLEFTLLGYEPELWEVSDSLTIGKYMSWVLGGNMETELLLMSLSEKLEEDKLKDIFPSYPEDGITIMKNAWQEVGSTKETADRLLSLTTMMNQSFLGERGIGIGSNNWVVSGKMTKSGYPILANDMHLEIKAPSIWYQNHLKVEGKMNVSGVIFPGVPGLIAGHNDRIAWGLTNLNPDVQDLYIEKQNPDNPHQFLYLGKWEDAEVKTYSIPVKGEEPVSLEVLITRHGPIISAIFDQPESVPLALQWTTHLPTAEMDTIIGMGQAKNLQEFLDSLQHFKVPAQNFVYADVDGNIAYRGNGLIPIRKKGDGQVPVPGWTGEYEWEGFIPYDELPTVINPDQGFLVTANNKVVDEAYPYFISNEWAPPYRAQTIYNSLKGRENLTLEEVLNVQSNRENLQAQTLAPFITRALQSKEWTKNEAKAKEGLLKWFNEGPRDLMEETGPTIYHTMYIQIIKNTFADEVGEEFFDKYLESNYNIKNTLDRYIQTDSIWFDDIGTEETEGKEGIIRKSFQDAVVELEKKLGNNIEKWQWGKLHTITFDHPLGSQKVLGFFYNKGPFPIGGSTVTPAAASFSLNQPFEVTSSAPWRYGVDMGNVNAGLDILFGGSSGHPFSKHYHDQVDLWLKDQYKPMWFNDNDIREAAKGKVITLTPVTQ